MLGHLDFPYNLILDATDAPASAQPVLDGQGVPASVADGVGLDEAARERKKEKMSKLKREKPEIKRSAPITKYEDRLYSGSESDIARREAEAAAQEVSTDDEIRPQQVFGGPAEVVDEQEEHVGQGGVSGCGGAVGARKGDDDGRRREANHVSMMARRGR